MRSLSGTLLLLLTWVSLLGCSVDFSGFQTLPSSGIVDGDGRIPGAFDFKTYNVTTGPDNSFEFAQSVHQQSSGKILSLIVKQVDYYYETLLVRHLADGTLDASFGNSGILKIHDPEDRFEEATHRVAVLSDDTIVYFRAAASAVRFKRFSAEGVLDTSFGTSGRVTHNVALTDRFAQFLARPDGKLILVGETATSEIVLRQFTAAGLVDTSFGSSGRFVISPTPHDDYPDVVKLDGNGKILIASSGSSDWSISRVAGDGSLDNTFGSGGTLIVPLAATLSTEPKDVQVNGAGDIFVAVKVGPNSGGTQSVLTKILDNGSVDTTFGTSGSVAVEADAGSTDFIEKFHIQGDGKFLATGIYDDSVERKIYTTRLNADGSPDVTYPAVGTYAIAPDRDKVADSLLQADGKWYVMGHTPLNSDVGNNDLFLMRINTDGSLDTSFNTVGVAILDVTNGSGDSLAHSILQRDGKILSAGNTTNGAAFAGVLMRLLPSGERDTSFGTNGIVSRSLPGGTSAGGYLKVIELADGKILALGYHSDGSAGDLILSRYLSDGSLDASFATAGTATYAHSLITPSLAFAVGTDGKIVVSATLAADGRTRLLRFNSDGSLDASFGTAGEAVIDIVAGKNDVPKELKILSNGQMLIVGFVPNGGIEGFLAKFNSDGTLDTTFNVSGVIRLPNAELTAIELYGESKYFLGGRRGLSKYLVVAINAEGTFDDLFGGNGISEIATTTDAGYISNMFVQADGKILANVYEPDKSASKKITIFRTLATGAIDNAFGAQGYYTSAFGDSPISSGMYLLRTPDQQLMATGYALDGSYDFSFKYLNDL